MNATVARYLREGRGQGEGSTYRPWIQVNDFPSMGRVSRVLGVKTKRIHHLLSDNQYRAFLIFEWNSHVVDIRESYPLLDVRDVVDNIDDLRFDRFVDKASGEPAILTTSFLLTRLDAAGKEQLIARSVKNSSELRKKIAWEKLEIERRYWQAKSIEWKVITDRQLPKAQADGIAWARETLLQAQPGVDRDVLAPELVHELFAHREWTVRRVLNLFEKQQGLDPGTGLYLWRYLIATKSIQVNLASVTKLSETVEIILR